MFWIILTLAFFLFGFTGNGQLEPEKALYKMTMGDMMNIGTAIDSYIIDFGKAPVVKDFSELALLLVPFYIKTLPMADAWGNPYLYRLDPMALEKPWAAHIYYIGSGGGDSVFEGWEQYGDYQELNGQDLILTNCRPAFSCKPVIPYRKSL